jgi:hypothetical protein
MFHGCPMLQVGATGIEVEEEEEEEEEEKNSPTIQCYTLQSQLWRSSLNQSQINK